VLVQGQTVPVPTDTNPDHIFEVHPLLTFDSATMPTAFVPIPGYTAYTATRAFGTYEQITFRVKKMASFTTISGQGTIEEVQAGPRTFEYRTSPGAGDRHQLHDQLSLRRAAGFRS